MGWKDIPEATKFDLAKRYAGGENLDSMARELNIPTETLYRRLREYKNAIVISAKAEKEGIDFREIPHSTQFTQYLNIKLSDAIIISDLEMPDTDPVMLETVLLLAMRHKIKTLIIAGDVDAGDQAGLSTWLRTWSYTGEISYEGSIGRLNRLLVMYLDWFRTIYLCTGNHDQRIAKMTNGQAHLGMFINQYGERVQFSRFRYLWIDTPRGYALVSHPSNYSENSAALAAQIYEKSVAPDGRKPRFVIVAHTHQPQFRKSRDGLAECYALGCLRDPLRTQYLQENSNKFAAWGQSILLLQSGYFRHLERDSTNWELELGRFAEKASICGKRV